MEDALKLTNRVPAFENFHTALFKGSLTCYQWADHSDSDARKQQFSNRSKFMGVVDEYKEKIYENQDFDKSIISIAINKVCKLCKNPPIILY